MRKKNNFLWWFGIVGGIVLLLSFRTIQSYIKGTGPDVRVPCINPTLPIPASLHIHPELTIMVNGEKIPVPTNIGIELAGCERALHTHDETGTIHVEPNFAQDFTLGDFFYVWNRPLSKDQILDYKTDNDHEIVMTVDGVPSDVFEKLVLKDKQQIKIEYRKRS